MPERRAIFAIPGDLDTPTGGSAYDRRMIAELRRLGWDIRHVPLSSQFPMPDAATLGVVRRALAAALPRAATLASPDAPTLAVAREPPRLTLRHDLPRVDLRLTVA